MTPRIEISAVEINDGLEKALHVLIDSGHSKIPVYKDDLDTWKNKTSKIQFKYKRTPKQSDNKVSNVTNFPKQTKQPK